MNMNKNLKGKILALISGILMNGNKVNSQEAVQLSNSDTVWNTVLNNPSLIKKSDSDHWIVTRRGKEFLKKGGY